MAAPEGGKAGAGADTDPTPPADAPAWISVAPVLFLLIWSGGFAFAKMGLAYVEPLTFLAMRYGAAVAILLPIFLVIRPALPRTWERLARPGGGRFP